MSFGGLDLKVLAGVALISFHCQVVRENNTGDDYRNKPAVIY
jgi:hypothetical protein